MEKKRNVQDIETPSLTEVLRDAGFDMRTEEDINIYLEDRYEEAIETRQVVADKQSALADDISSRWQSRSHKQHLVSDNEWWLEEDAFSFNGEESKDTNPFK